MLKVEIISSVKMGENGYIIYKEGQKGCVVVDPGEDTIENHPIFKDKKVEAVLLTHGHFDHIQGVRGLMDNHKAPLFVHLGDEAMLYDSKLNLSGLFGTPFVIEGKARVIEEGPLPIGSDFAFKVLHTPGHTKGSVCYQIEELLFTGDTLFERGYGRVDFPGGSMEEMEQSLTRLLDLPGNLVVYPGHGSSSTIEKCRESFK